MDAGDEFLAAEREAQRQQVPCLCIDLDMAPRHQPESALRSADPPIKVHAAASDASDAHA